MLTSQRIGAVLILAFCLAYASLIGDIPDIDPDIDVNQPLTARSMPNALAILGVVLSTILMFKPSEERPQWRGLSWGRLAAFVGLMVIYSLSLRAAGFVLSTGLFLGAGFYILGARHPAVLLFVPASITLFFWFIMAYLLDLTLHPWPRF